MAIEKPRGIRTTLLIYVLAFSAKISVFFLTGFIALMADALNSLTDIALALMMLMSFRLSRIPADESHPFGHGRGENAAALVAGVAFITVVSFGILRESVPKLLDPVTPTADPIMGIAALVFSMIINTAGILVLRSDLVTGESPASKALLVDLINDQFSAGAAIVGIWGATNGYPLADPVAGTLIAGIIAYTAFRLVKENLVFLIGESPDQEFYHRVEEVVLGVEGVMDVHDVMAEYIGPEKVHVDLHIRVEPEMTVAEADPLTEDVSSGIKAELPQVTHAMVHVCPHGGGRRATVEDAD